MQGTFGFKEYKLAIEFFTPMLGTVPKNKDVYAAYIADKVTDKKQLEDELKTVEEIEGKGWTGFHKSQDDKGLFLYNYMVKGFFKAAVEALMENGAVKKIPAYKKWIDRMIHVRPRRIYLGKTDPDGIIERPLRTMTPKGERVTVTRSDIIEEGTQLEFNIRILNNGKKINGDLLQAAFDFGQYCGLGQWRGSGGYGAFDVISFEDVTKE